MKKRIISELKVMSKSLPFWLFVFFLFLLFFTSMFGLGNASYEQGGEINKLVKKLLPAKIPPLDTAEYDRRMTELANNPPPLAPTTKVVKDPKTGAETIVTVEPKPVPPNLWPVKTVYPNAGAILPFKRIIAYYGNLYSKKMGVLGEYPEAEMLSRLNTEVDKWNVADPNTPAIPALHYIAVVAQASAGEDGKYRARMPGSEIDKVLKIAEKINAIVFLDIQVGFSTIQTELPLLEKYLKLPNVHLGMDPEFSMKSGIRPGKIVGTYDAADVNFAANYLAKIVQENNLTPKILVVHRYTQKMVTNYRLITPLPEVQIVMHMDGWGGAAKKMGTYRNFIYPEPVQFAGFKLFYKNDILTPGTTLMTPLELLKLRPQPIYIQYQ
ncbi:MAG: hypothetical protein AAB815_00955 [Patescibacteria group bacterium]